MQTTPDLNNRIHLFASELAAAIGGTHAPTGGDGEYRDWCAQVLMPDYGVFIRQDNGGRRMEIITMPGAVAARNRVSISRQWPRGSVAMERPVADQVRDVVRRIINADELPACVAEAKARLEADAAAEARKAEAFAILEAAGARRSQHTEAEFHNGTAPGTYYVGRVERSGQVTFTRLGSVTPDQAARIIAVLAEG